MILTGVDVSRYQGNMDWQKCKSAGALFGVARATVGDYYIDPQLTANIAGVQDACLALGVYHVVTPSDSTGRKITAQMQMDHLFQTIAGVHLDMPVVLDCELDRGATPAEMTALIRECVRIIRGKFYAYPFIYTSAGWWNPHVLRSQEWIDCPLWVANYTTANQPLLPLDWSQWVMWQYSADGNGKGAEYGAQSASIDLNRFDTVTGAIYGIEIESGPCATPEYVRCQAPLNIRAAAGTTATVKATTRVGSTWKVIGTANDTQGRIWYQIAEQAFIASWLCEAVTG